MFFGQLEARIRSSQLTLNKHLNPVLSLLDFLILSLPSGEARGKSQSLGNYATEKNTLI